MNGHEESETSTGEVKPTNTTNNAADNDGVIVALDEKEQNTKNQPSASSSQIGAADLPKEKHSECKKEEELEEEVPVVKLSKNQLKKKRRWERKMEIKKRRKMQEKEIKIAKAKAAGRDLEQERKLEEQLRLAGLGKE